MTHAEALILRGEKARAAEDRAGAAEFYEKACVEFESERNAKRALHALRHAAELRLQAGEVAKAREEMGQVLAAYREDGTDGLEMAHALRVAAMAEEAAGSRERAREMWVKARVLYQDAGVEAGTLEAGRRLMGLEG